MKEDELQNLHDVYTFIAIEIEKELARYGLVIDIDPFDLMKERYLRILETKLPHLINWTKREIDE